MDPVRIPMDLFAHRNLLAAYDERFQYTFQFVQHVQIGKFFTHASFFFLKRENEVCNCLLDSQIFDEGHELTTA